MEIDEAAEAPINGRGQKRPPSTENPLTEDAEGSSMSTASDDDGWEVNSSEEKEDEEVEDQGTCRPFTVEEFPRLSNDHYVQTTTIYTMMQDLRRRGPSPLSLFPPLNDPVMEGRSHWFASQYQLHDESEISVNNAASFDCSNGCKCISTDLLQVIDLKIAGYRHAQPRHARIFGSFAVRDKIEPLRNYVYKHDADNYEAVSVNPKTGMARLSLSSPARGICITSYALFEFKLFIRTEGRQEEPKDDILIEGCTEIDNIFGTESFVETGRLYGEKCGLDVTFAVLNIAVQATVSVEIVRAPACGLNLKLYAKSSGFNNVICLFQGVAEAGRKLSSVVAVVKFSHLDLRIEGSSVDTDFSLKSSREEWKSRFYACYHGIVDEEVELGDFAAISVKITWKAVNDRRVRR